MDKGERLIVSLITNAARDPKFAVWTAQNDYSSQDSWSTSQAGQSAAYGALFVLVPWLNIIGAVADLFVLVHKMAYASQGAAGLVKCPISNETFEADMAVILALWTDAVREGDLMAMFANEAATGQMEVPNERQESPKNEFFECPLQTTGEIVLVDKAGRKMLANVGAILLRRLARTFFARVGGKLAISLTPFVSTVASGLVAKINYRLVREVAHCAEVYYTNKKAFLDSQSGKAEPAA